MAVQHRLDLKTFQSHFRTVPNVSVWWRQFTWHGIEHQCSYWQTWEVPTGAGFPEMTKSLVHVGSQRRCCWWVTSSVTLTNAALASNNREKKEVRKRERKSSCSLGSMSSLRGQCSTYKWAVDLLLLYPFLGYTTSMAWLEALERTSSKQFVITFTSSLLYFYPWLPNSKWEGFCVSFVFSLWAGSYV